MERREGQNKDDTGDEGGRKKRVGEGREKKRQ